MSQTETNANNVDTSVSLLQHSTGNSTPQLPSQHSVTVGVNLDKGKNVASQPSQPSQPNSSDLPPSKKAKIRSATCWTSNWFKLLDPKKNPDGKPRAECTKCGSVFMADTVKNGTSNLNKHMKKCPKRENKDIAQMIMRSSEGKVNLRDLKIDPTVLREMVLTLVVKKELPLRFVEYEEFRKMMSYVYPDYSPISRNTLLSDIHKVFKKEKNALRDEIKNSAGRVSVTTDLWTSISNDGYMTLTAHYIDKSWVLHKKLIKFSILTPPHSGVNIGEAVRKILIEWGVEERLFSITVDNASANDVGVSFLKNTLMAKNALVCNGDFFHIRCCAHILNLIVQDGIKLIDACVQKVRDSVKFVKSSQARKVKFGECCERVGMTTNRGLHGDVSTRWNSTFKMLDDALHYRKAFENLCFSDPSYTCVPSPEEWEKIAVITQLLMPFDEITKVLSGSTYPTSNLYFMNVVEVRQILNDESLDLLGGGFLEDMLRAMRRKFNKYWDQYSLILSVAVVMDPCSKFTILEWAYDRIHDGNTFLIQKSLDRVRDALHRLYGEYKSMSNEQGSSSSITDDDGTKRKCVQDYITFYKRTRIVNSGAKTELDIYLTEPVKPWEDNFDVLAYWKVSEGQYPDLARLARDVLAIPVSTVASESAFSAGGRVIDKYRSKLLPKNVEALICLRDWMCDVDFAAASNPDEDIEELHEALGDVFSLSHAPTEVCTSSTITNID